MPKKKPKEGKPQVHDDLKGFELNINEFGEIKTNMDIEKLNKFLNKNVEDKKLKDRDDLEDLKSDEDPDDEELNLDDDFDDFDEEEDDDY